MRKALKTLDELESTLNMLAELPISIPARWQRGFWQMTTAAGHPS